MASNKPPRAGEELIPTRWTLINRLKDWDDQESWREFFDLYWKLIYASALKVGLTSQEAQDVVQETIISVCKSIKTFQADPAHGSFKGWLLKLTRWRVLDQIRKRPAEVNAAAHVRAPNAGDSTAETSTVARIPDPSANTLDQIWENEWERNILTAALEKLERQTSAKHYQVFYLHVIKQRTVEQVAKVTGVSAEQVYLIKHRLGITFKAAIQDLEAKMQ